MVRTQRRVSPGQAVAWAVVAVAVIVTIVPFYWMVRAAFTPSADVFTDNFALIPERPTLVNFKRVLGLTTLEEAQAAGGSGASLNFLLYLRNSVIYTGLIVCAQTMSCAMAGYALARLQFRGRQLVFGIFIAALMVPWIFTILPNFALVRQLGLLNTFAGLVAPTLLMTPFAVFFLRQFFLSLPTDVEDAALIDGASKWTIFWRVVMPMSKGPLFTIALTLSVWTWKDFLWPLLVGREEGTRVLTAALMIFLQQAPNSRPDWTGLMAGATLTVIPMMILLVVMGRRIVESINFSGGK